MDAAATEQTVLFRERAVALLPKAFEVIGTFLHNADASPFLKLRAAAMILKMPAEPKSNRLKSAAPSFEETLADRLNMTNQEFAQNCTLVSNSYLPEKVERFANPPSRAATPSVRAVPASSSNAVARMWGSLQAA